MHTKPNLCSCARRTLRITSGNALLLTCNLAAEDPELDTLEGKARQLVAANA